MSVEWSVLEAIHPTICVSNEDGIVVLRVPVELGVDTPLRVFSVPHDVYLSAAAALPASADLCADPVFLSALPPIQLRIALPPLYPSRSPPVIQSLQATPAWLPPSMLPLIKQHMAAMWSPGDDSGILYTWVEWIRTGEFLADVGLLADDMHSIQLPHPSPQLLLTPLLAYFSATKLNQFAHTSYLCAICLSERKGVHCVALSCGHVFCKTCLVDMWRLHIKEGQISRVACPQPDCGKTDATDADGLREATEDEVRAILSENELCRWRWLRKKRDLERDPTMIHCPIEYCQEPVPKPKSDLLENRTTDGDESGWSRLRTCNACNYSFCAFCRRTWHGPHTPCPLLLTSKFILDYLSAPPNSFHRHAIERRYGRGIVLRLVKQHEEEQENRKWMESSTMACPGCEVRVEKSMGCNHMTCARCGTHFCYRCGTKIPGTNPYQHFSTPRMPCFSKLFDLVPSSEDEWQPIEGFDFI